MDICVVGAGPVGLVLAERLARAGVRVTVLEQRKKIYRKVCSGLVSANTVRKYNLKTVAENVVHGARLHAGNITISIERKKVAYVFDRYVLDKYLCERAESSGAEICFGKRFSGANGRDADVFVGADGFASTVRSEIGLPMPRYVMGAIGVVKGKFDNYVDVYLDHNLAPGFFAWVIPRSDNVAEIGIGIDSKYSSEVLSRLRTFAMRCGFKSFSVLGARPIPVDFPMGRVVYGRTALVGDAAVQTKATTGGGITYGLLAADALGGSIASGNIWEYQRYHRFFLYPRLLAHMVVRKYLNSVNYERLLSVLKELEIEKKLSRRGDMDDPTFLLSKEFAPVIFRSAFLLI